MRLVELEEKMGMSPLTLFMRANDGEIPALKYLLLILHYSLQAMQHNIKLADTYKIYDDFIADGGAMTDLFEVIVETFKVSGVIPKDVDESKN